MRCFDRVSRPSFPVLIGAMALTLAIPVLAMAGPISDPAVDHMPPPGNPAMNSNPALPAVVGNAFTYQGQLIDDGAPANGAYDLQFSLWDAANGGVQIGSTVLVNDVAVADGRFTAELDFGQSAFGGGARWLAITVRPGASGGAYTPLSPRQKLNAAPYALALPMVYPVEASGFVGIGRDFRISIAEAFGVNASTGPFGYGGMFVNTTDGAGWPFYGFATGGSFRAWTYYDGSENTWNLYNGGLRLTVPTTGGLRIQPFASGDGISISQTGDDGIQVGSAGLYPSYGLYIPSPGVAFTGLWPNTANASGQWGLFTTDNISAGNVFASGQTLIARVANGALGPGDVVAAAGVADPVPGSTERLVEVQLAGRDATGIVGVVASRMVFEVAPGKEQTGERALQAADGPARAGDYVALVVLGVADVKVDRSASIAQGTRLTAAEAGGRVRPLRTESLNGMPVTEGAQVVGIALAATRAGDDTVPTFVTLK